MGAAGTRRKAAEGQIEDINWDADARQDYLTGFHKRKQQRIQQAQKTAAEKERLQRIEDRKHIREQRKKDIDRHVQEVNAAVKKAEAAYPANGTEKEGPDSEWSGFEDDDEGPDDPRNDEYIDEDKYTTVTVEPMGPNDEESSTDGDGDADGDADERKTSTRKTADTKKPKTEKPKKRRKKFRYETKTERQEGRRREKQRSSKSASARRARE